MTSVSYNSYKNLDLLGERTGNQKAKLTVPIVYQFVVTLTSQSTCKVQNNKGVENAPQEWKEKAAEN